MLIPEWVGITLVPFQGPELEKNTQSSLDVPVGWVPGFALIPKSVAAQVPYIKWLNICI